MNTGEGVMGRPLRMYEDGSYYFVTARCFQSRLLLRPSALLNEVIGGVLARATKEAKVEVCGFVAASSHVHLLCRAQDGELSKFMKYFLGNVSKKVGRLVDWPCKLWERRFSAEPVLDKAALEGRLKYILAHGVKEGLVRSVADWPGLSCVSQLLGESKRTFRFFAWAKRWQSGKLLEDGHRPWSPLWATDEVLELHPLEHWKNWSQEKRRARVLELIAEVEEEGRAQHPRVAGVEKVVGAHPHTRPLKPDRRPRPMCHASTKLARDEYKETYRNFVSRFRAAVECLRTLGVSKEVKFPPFAFVPFLAAGAGALRKVTDTFTGTNGVGAGAAHSPAG
ncbi:MAG: hypothetical protein QM723_20395 [Myxococcaceae bacterium]